MATRRLLLAAPLLLLLTACPDDPPPQLSFTPRIGDSPATPQVSGTQMRVQVTTHAGPPAGGALGDVALYQELQLVREYYRGGQLIAAENVARLRVERPGAQGDWSDTYDETSAMMDRVNADRFVYRVHARLLTQQRISGRPLDGPGVFQRRREVHFGPAATEADRGILTPTPLRDVDIGYRYEMVQEAVVYTITWEVAKALTEAPGSNAPTVARTGSWGIAFWTPLSAFALNQRLTF